MAAAQQLSLRLGIGVLARMQHPQGILRRKRGQGRNGFVTRFRTGVHHELQQELKGGVRPRQAQEFRRHAALWFRVEPMLPHIRAGLGAVEMAQRDDGFPLQQARGRLRSEGGNGVHQVGRGLMRDAQTSKAAQHGNALGLVGRLHHHLAHLVR
jgi:hypothetical protein